MKKLPIGLQTIRRIIEEGYVYVDKTQYVYDLLNGSGFYFLSRPRRFGKSLFLDTIAEVFSGDRELFKGLWIYDSDYGFEKYPVIRLDMSSISNETPDVLNDSILGELRVIYEKEGFEATDAIPSDAFKRLIRNLHSKYNQKVAVLIDEYDKPILDHIDKTEMADANRRVIRGFYGILKSMEPHLRFTFFTGVSKFTKASLFSELNNLNDITMIDSYANICGIPVESLDEYFGEHIASLREDKWYQDCEDMHELILSWYDGYSWDAKTKLLNPFSLLNFFGRKRFHSFWYSSGSPKFLIDFIKRQPEIYTSLKNFRITEDMLDAVDIDKIMVVPLLFQTGYLTVKETLDSVYGASYIVDIPNFEVRNAFNLHILSALTEKEADHTGMARMEISEALEAGDLQKMLDMLRGLFASIPYQLHVPNESYYHSIFYAAMSLLGFDMAAEVSTSRGRIDATLELDDKAYVMEFKYVDCPPEASDEEKRALFDKALIEGLGQINDRGYHKKYIGSGKTIYKAVFAFLGRDNIEMIVECG
ncbi:MAG: ATP-binding protein [Oscillospiraceae bacterium]|nr:ATP-binding protein [Oscillospiraceae bacterium]